MKIGDAKILTSSSIDDQILNFALPKNTSSQTSILSMLKQARDKGMEGVASPVPDFFARFIDLKSNGELDNPLPTVKPTEETKQW